MVPGIIRDPSTRCYQRSHGMFLLGMLSNDDLLPATSEFQPSFPRSMFPSRAAAADCAESADLGLDTGVTLYMSFLLMSFTPFYSVPVAELLLVSITGKRRRDSHRRDAQGLTGGSQSHISIFQLRISVFGCINGWNGVNLDLPRRWKG